MTLRFNELYTIIVEKAVKDVKIWGQEKSNAVIIFTQASKGESCLKPKIFDFCQKSNSIAILIDYRLLSLGILFKSQIQQGWQQAQELLEVPLEIVLMIHLVSAVVEKDLQLFVEQIVVNIVSQSSNIP